MKLARRSRFAIFDLDGVLLDTEPLYTDGHGRRSPRASARSTTGRSSATASGAARWRRRGSSWTRSALPLSPEALVRERDRVLVDLVARAPAIAGAEAFTRALAERGVPMAIATSTEAPLFAIKAARHRDWLAIFRAAVCGDDPRVARSKPAPDIFLAAAQDLGAPPADCLVFEDSPFGVEAARAAGMQVIALPDPAMDRARYASADAMVAGFAELTLDRLGF